MSISQGLQARQFSGRWSGFGNMVFREGHKWWGTRRWWMLLLVWFVVLNGFLAFGLYVLPKVVESASMEQSVEAGTMTAEEVQQEIPAMFLGIASFLLPVGVIILVQGQVHVEKQNGVAAWILSKPISRSTYLCAKLLADAAGIVLIMVVLQMVPAYWLVTSVFEWPAVDFVVTTGLLVLLLLFYQSFAMMMSVLGRSTEIVLGVSLGVCLGGVLLKDALVIVLRDAFYFTPWALPGTMSLTLMGQPLPQLLLWPVIAVPVWTLLCWGVMFWQFQRQDL